MDIHIHRRVSDGRRALNNNMEHITSKKPYIIGFVLSIIFTLTAYIMVQIHVSSEHSVISHEILIPAILTLAIAQLFVQLVFFLHLAREDGPRWKLAILISTMGIVLLIVVGSIWIIGHLNYNMMASPSDMNQYINSQDSL